MSEMQPTWDQVRDELNQSGIFANARAIVTQFDDEGAWITDEMTGVDITAAVAARSRLDLAAGRERAAQEMLDQGVERDRLLHTPGELQGKAKVQRAMGENIMNAAGIDQSVIDQVEPGSTAMRLAAEVNVLEYALQQQQLITPGHELTRQSMHGEL